MTHDVVLGSNKVNVNINNNPVTVFGNFVHPGFLKFLRWSDKQNKETRKHTKQCWYCLYYKRMVRRVSQRNSAKANLEDSPVPNISVLKEMKPGTYYLLWIKERIEIQKKHILSVHKNSRRRSARAEIQEIISA